MRSSIQTISFASFTVLAILASGGEESLEPKAAAQRARFDPVKQEMEGWTVHVDPALLQGENAEEGKKALRMLGDHLHRISLLVEASRLQNLRRCEIWIEREHPTLKAMQYHPALDWLEKHGHDPRLAKKVHITRAGALLERAQLLKHPAVVLHELAHAYHDQFLTFGHRPIIEAYEKAMEAGLYDKVLLFDGRLVAHYAKTNHKEYFAESTEAYFYRNDFYPFVRAELKEHDPVMHGVMEQVWGKLE